MVVKNGSGREFQALESWKLLSGCQDNGMFYFGGSAPFGHSSHNSPL